MLSFLIIVFSLLLFFSHRKIIYAALMALDEISLAIKRDAAHICTTPEQQILMFPPLSSDSEEG